MATPSVIRHSLGDPTRSQPVRPWWQQRPPVDIDAAYGTLSISDATLAVGRAYGSGGSLASGAALRQLGDGGWRRRPCTVCLDGGGDRAMNRKDCAGSFADDGGYPFRGAVSDAPTRTRVGCSSRTGAGAGRVRSTRVRRPGWSNRRRLARSRARLSEIPSSQPVAEVAPSSRTGRRAVVGVTAPSERCVRSNTQHHTARPALTCAPSPSTSPAGRTSGSAPWTRYSRG